MIDKENALLYHNSVQPRRKKYAHGTNLRCSGLAVCTVQLQMP